MPVAYNEEVEEAQEEETPPPLWLPPGSVRAAIALFVVSFTGASLGRGIVLPEWWVLTFQGIVAMYFGSRFIPEIIKKTRKS